MSEFKENPVLYFLLFAHLVVWVHWLCLMRRVSKRTEREFQELMRTLRERNNIKPPSAPLLVRWLDHVVNEIKSTKK